MGRYVRIHHAELDRWSVVPESAAPHFPGWTCPDPSDVRPNEWDWADEEELAAERAKAEPEPAAPKPSRNRRANTAGEPADTSKEG